MLRPKVVSLIPDRLLRKMENHWGWFLYAKAVKP